MSESATLQSNKQSHVTKDDDYDVAYAKPRTPAVSSNADLPLFFTITEFPKVVTVKELLDRCRLYLSKADIEKIHSAFRLADAAHLGQFRKSGEAYITHPVSVASILADWHLDADTICAGLMHDVLEDTGTDKAEIAQKFGMPVAELVDGVSKLDKLKFSSTELAQAESFRKMLLAMSRDVRVILIKLADRLHNMRTLGVMRPEKRRRIATETLEIFVPIAHHLGLNALYRELKELAFMNQHPERYRVLKERVMRMRDQRRTALERILRETREALPKSGIIAQVQGRDRTIYGIYNRMRDNHESFSEVLDIYGFRVIVRTVEECYLTLCALHKLYKPVHHRFKDFIAIPKSNGYQSLHTTVIGPFGTPVEYQIRTEAMHRIAEKGILAHWLYEDGMDTDRLQTFVTEWLHSLLAIQSSSTDSVEFLENIKSDLFPTQLYAFTPKSKILSLPEGSVAIDFAYVVHTDVGNHACACRINGESKPLATPLKNGDMVEIVTAKDAHPKPEWLRSVRTGKARAEIREYLRTCDPQESIRLGLEAIKSVAAETNIVFEAIPENIWDKVLSEAKLATKDALFSEIGLGKLFAATLVSRLSALMAKGSTPKFVTVRGTEGVAVQLAGCCHPIPGDDIFGFLRRGHGITVHRNDCIHVQHGRQNDAPHWIELQWEQDADTKANFSVPIELVTNNEREALAHAASVLSKLGSSITALNIRDMKHERTKIVRMNISVRNRMHLAQILKALKEMTSVAEIARCLDGSKRLPYIL